MFIRHLKETITNLRQMPEKQRKRLFFSIMAVAALVAGFFQIQSTIKSVGALGQSIPKISLQIPLEGNVPPPDSIVPPAVGQEEIQSWTVYTNTGYGYQLQYPEYWFIDSSNSGDVFISPVSPDDKTAFTGEALQIYAQDNKEEATIDQVLEKRFGKDSSVYTRENILIGGQYAVKATTTCQAIGCGTPEWIVVADHTIYHLTSGLNYRPIFDQIISTIIFSQ